jgi:hypothetical protein
MRHLMTMNATDINRITMTGHAVPDEKAADYFEATHSGTLLIKQQGWKSGDVAGSVTLTAYTDPADGESRFALIWTRDRVWQISDTAGQERAEKQFFLVAARDAVAVVEAGGTVDMYDPRPAPAKKTPAKRTRAKRSA